MTFSPTTAGDNVITATAGTGLVFDQANGTYNIGQTTLNGGSASVSLTNSNGAFTFSACTITSPSSTAFNVSGGSATIAYTGSIVQANSFAALSVSNHSGGTMTFSPTTAGDDVITATAGTGLVFDQANGTYNIGQTTLNGGSASVALTNSNGTFTLSACTITSPSSTAFNVSGGSGTVNFTGLITQANNFAAVSVSGGNTARSRSRRQPPAATPS